MWDISVNIIAAKFVSKPSNYTHLGTVHIYNFDNISILYLEAIFVLFTFMLITQIYVLETSNVTYASTYYAYAHQLFGSYPR